MRKDFFLLSILESQEKSTLFLVSSTLVSFIVRPGIRKKTGGRYPKKAAAAKMHFLILFSIFHLLVFLSLLYIVLSCSVTPRKTGKIFYFRSEMVYEEGVTLLLERKIQSLPPVVLLSQKNPHISIVVFRGAKQHLSSPSPPPPL